MSIADLFDPNAMMAPGPVAAQAAPAAPPVSQRGFLTPRTQRTMPDGLSPRAQALFQALAGNRDLPQFNVISGYRDPNRNAAVGGARGSQHVHGNAMDIDVSSMSDEQKAALLRAATAAGARGIGIYPSGRSLHIDVRDTPTVWGGNPAGAYRGMTLDQAPQWARPILGDVLGQTVASGAPRTTPQTADAPMIAPTGPGGPARGVQTTAVAPEQAPTGPVAGNPAVFADMLAQQGTANAMTMALQTQQNQIAQREKDAQARRAALFGGVAGLYGS